jgi:hypothetical protein
MNPPLKMAIAERCAEVAERCPVEKALAFRFQALPTVLNEQ